MKQKTLTTPTLRLAPAVLAGLLFTAQIAPAQVQVFTLESAIEYGMSNSPMIKNVELRLVTSTENYNARVAQLKPNFSLSLNPFAYNSRQTFDNIFSQWYSNETSSSSATFSVRQQFARTDGTLTLNNTLQWQDYFNESRDTRTKTFDNNFRIAYTQPIFTFNRTKLELEELELDIENTGYEYALQKLSLEQNITRGFYNLYLAKQSLEIAQKDYENSQESYTIQKNKVEAGLLPAEEMYQAELNLAGSQSDLLNSQQSLENTFDSFKQQLGISIYDSIDVDTDVTYTPVDVDLNLALNNGLKTRMELRQAEMNIQQQLNNVTRTAAMNEFAGDITVSYGMAGNDESFAGVLDKPQNTGMFNLTFDIPLFDWGEKAARMRSAEAGVERSEISLENQRIAIIVAIRSSHRELQNLERQIEIARQQVEAAQLTYNINLERYKNGDLTSLDLSLVQDQLTSANLNEIRALINYKNAVLDMKVLALWDFENDEPVIPENIIDYQGL